MFTSHNQSVLRSQRGAMFGLDARIALAIFGGLSVIAGVAVVSSIRETNVVSLISEFDNISKGYINYSFDTGIDVPLGTSAGEGFSALYEESSPATLGWNGPYITIATDSHNTYGDYSLVRHNINTSWGGASMPSANSDNCTGGNICGVWLLLTDVPCEIAGDIDQRIDGTADGTDGNLRYDDTCSESDTPSVAYLLSRRMSSS